MKTRCYLLALTLAGLAQLSALHPQPAFAQSADSFNPDIGLGYPWPLCMSLAVQPDGKILVGGGFGTLGGQTRTNIGRLNPDGTLDSGFNPGVGRPGSYSYDLVVYSLAVQADRKTLVGGYFTTLGGRARYYLGRLNADGTLDNGFNPGANTSVSSLVVQADGKILVGGYFTMLGGAARSFIGRLNADGTLDSGFNPGASGTVRSLALQADGKILVGGEFTTLGGQPRSRIGRLNTDGTLDSGFNPGANTNVTSLAVQADGKILVGGQFTTLGGQPRNGIGRLNTDGTLDSGFNPEGPGTYAPVYSLAPQAGGKILVAGGPTTRRTPPQMGYNCVVRLNADGTLDSACYAEASGVWSSYPPPPPCVFSLAVLADGKVLVGGRFTALGLQPRNNLGRLNTTEPATQSLSRNGSTITWLRGGSSPEVGRTSFEVSTNGIDWVSLGAGTYVPGGWQLTSAALPPGGTIRARGYVTGGQYNASSWFVESVIGPPSISSHPLSVTNAAGTTASFSTLAGGAEPLAYQWFKDGVALANGLNISGATTSTLSVSNLLKTDEGGYRVVISNALGSVTSQVATLTVIDPWISAQRSVNSALWARV